jgi:hypothetical protein
MSTVIGISFKKTQQISQPFCQECNNSLLPAPAPRSMLM